MSQTLGCSVSFTEIPVAIRDTDLATHPVEVLVPTDNCCDDCPEKIENPPSQSDCPFFNIIGGIAVCERPGGMEGQIKKFLSGGGTI